MRGRIAVVSRPKAPADLWARMDAVLDAARMREVEVQPNWFTAQQYADRYHITKEASLKQLHRLVKAGKVRLVGRHQRTFYFELL